MNRVQRQAIRRLTPRATNTLAFLGANRPKLAKRVASQKTTTVSSGHDCTWWPASCRAHERLTEIAQSLTLLVHERVILQYGAPIVRIGRTRYFCHRAGGQQLSGMCIRIGIEVDVAAGEWIADDRHPVALRADGHHCALVQKLTRVVGSKLRPSQPVARASADRGVARDLSHRVRMQFGRMAEHRLASDLDGLVEVPVLPLSRPGGPRRGLA